MIGVEVLICLFVLEVVFFVFGIVGGKLNLFLYVILCELLICYFGVCYEVCGLLMGVVIVVVSGWICVVFGEMGLGFFNLVGGFGIVFNNNFLFLFVMFNNYLIVFYFNCGMFMDFDI